MTNNLNLSNIMKSVLVTIADGTEELEAVTIIDVLRRADAVVTVASIGELEVSCSHGTAIIADCHIADCKDKIYDLIVLPGGLPGADNLRDSDVLTEMLKKQKFENRFYAAICASPAVVLQTHGLLEDKKATCYPGFGSDFQNHSDDSVVIDGYCITSQGPGTAMEFALTLVELLIGKEVKETLSKAMCISN